LDIPYGGIRTKVDTPSPYRKSVTVLDVRAVPRVR
jgi:hypothetical protein